MIIHIKPSDIYFTHSSICNKFTGCGKLLEDTLSELISGKTNIVDIPKIKVFHIIQNGNITYLSENNRRLWVFKELEKKGFLSTIEVRLEKTTNKKYYKNTYSLDAKMKIKR